MAFGSLGGGLINPAPSPSLRPFVIRLSGLLAVVALVASFAGCASISVQPHSETTHAHKPARIYVAIFSTRHGEFNVDREKDELRDFKTNLQALLQIAMVTDLTKRLVPAGDAPSSGNLLGQHAWLIRGEFKKVNQGSRLLRGTIGFGAGGTKLETKVSVYDLDVSDEKPFLTFSTTGGSNAEPGAITGAWTDPVTAVVGMGLSGLGGLAHGVTEDTHRTAREITAVLSDYMFRHGWIDEDTWIHPKQYTP
jgi:hypothetical protein